MGHPALGRIRHSIALLARRAPLRWFALLVSFASACGPSVPTPATPSGDGPARIVLTVDGNPNGLYWDQKRDELLIADDANHRILSYSDAHGFAVAELLPDAGSAGPAGLGQLVMTPDGTLVVTRFGYGKSGGVIFITPGAEPQLVPGLDPERRRIGLTVGADGQLFDSWFVKVPDGRRGGIGVLSLAGTETEVPSQLTKPVAVLLREDTLFVSDQDQGAVLRAPRSEPSSFSPFARVERPDLLAAGPDGSLFTGGAGGKLYRIASDGTASVFASGFGEVRGVAYDPVRRRVFVVDHGKPDGAQTEAKGDAAQTTAKAGTGATHPHTPHTLSILSAD
jgi:hypothetical protein